MAWTCNAGTEEALREKAHNLFGQLRTEWASYGIYWRLGHSLDTIMDYFVYVDGSEAAIFADIASTAYRRSISSACWYDDFGWWGIAALKAAQSGLFADPSWFVATYGDCWSVMHDRATRVWANNDTKANQQYQPRFEGGVWNCDWSGTDACNTDNVLPPLPPSCGWGGQGDPRNLRGIQNTVTNALYLVLAARLFEAKKSDRYLQAAGTELGFLQSWFDLSKTDSQNGLLFSPNPGQGILVRERVATYASGINVCGYQGELAWSGDQGIVLGGLVDWLAIQPATSPRSGTSDTVAGILNGVAFAAVNGGYGGALMPWLNGNGGDPGDYATGIGVLMRYLLHADQKSQAIRTITRGTAYQGLIDANVAAALDGMPPDAEADLLSRLTNRLAILVAAIVMCKS